MSLPSRRLPMPPGALLTLVLAAGAFDRLDAQAAAESKPDSARIELARALIDTMRVGATFLEGIEMLTDLPTENETIPEVARTALRERAASELPELVTRLSSVYAAHFTRHELEQLLAFHSTPVARKLAELMDSADIEKISELWMMDLMGKVMQDLAAKGITFE